MGFANWIPRMLLAATMGLAIGCTRSEAPPAEPARKTLVATTSVLGAAAKDLAGDAFEIKVLIPNGLDLHAWEPSAKDIETLSRADFILQNGLGLEQTLAKALDRARDSGIPVFTATDHIAIRTVGEDEGEGHEGQEHDAHGHGVEHAHDSEGHAEHAHEGHAHEAGAPDPHFWTDPVAMDAAMAALADQLQSRFQVDLRERRKKQSERLKALDAEIRSRVEALPASHRRLVTGHESMGYFAARYGFTLVGAVIPGVSSSAESSAATIANLKALVKKHQVPTLFTEVGTPENVVNTLARECEVKVVPLPTHQVPEDGSYYTFARTLASRILEGLQ